jgi:glycosyltransferase involved in cell wall biosynthesis
MRIAMISEHASPLAALGSIDAGGQNIYVAQVARCLAKQGHHVDVFTRRDAPELPPTAHLAAGARVLNIPAGPPEFVPKEQLLAHMPAFTRAARSLLQRARPYDVVHANFFMSGQVALRLKDLFNLPMVMTFHALGLVRREHQREADTFPAARVDIERRIVRRADRLVAECPQDADDLMRLYRARPESITTIPCGVDFTEFAPGVKLAARRALGLADDEFIVLQLGRMVPRKGVDNVIRAIALLEPERRARLVVVGGESADPDDGATPEIARLRGIAQDCGAASRVTFIGRRQRHQLHAFYTAADVFVTTPWYEPFGITPLEAMASARPVVGSAVGGIKHSVVDGVTGFLVPPRDPAALAERLRRLHADPALALRMGLAGERRVRSEFTWDRVAADLAAVYAAVRRGTAPAQRRAAPQPTAPSGSWARA